MGERIPLGFLIADGREQPPIDAALGRGRLEKRPEVRQPLGHVSLEFAGFLVRKGAVVARLLLLQLAQPAAGSVRVEETIYRLHQIMCAALDDPLHRTGLGQGETDGDVRIEVVREGVLAGVDQGEARVPRVDVLERIGGRGCRLHPLQVRGDGPPHPLEQVLLRAVGAHGQAGRFQL